MAKGEITIFLTQYNNYTFNYRESPIFCPDDFSKSSAAVVVVCGKGLTGTDNFRNLSSRCLKYCRKRKGKMLLSLYRNCSLSFPDVPKFLLMISKVKPNIS